MAERPHQRLGERGDLSAYLAVGMLLPLLLFIGYGGAETVRALGLRSAIASVSFDALQTVEDQGGVSSSLASSLASTLGNLSGTPVTVSGTAAGQTWGAPVCLQVDAPAEIWLPGGSLSVQLGGSFCGKSDLPPLGG